MTIIDPLTGYEFDLVAVGQTVLQTHAPSRCAGEICSIHNQSEHHMRAWPQLWRGDRGIMERMCEHGVGHPDPDDRQVRLWPAAGVHGCDGCCVKPRPGRGVEGV
jgi:hypothetical protein